MNNTPSASAICAMSDLELGRLIAERLGYAMVAREDHRVTSWDRDPAAWAETGDFVPDWYLIAPSDRDVEFVGAWGLPNASDLNGAWRAAFTPDKTGAQGVPFWPRDLGAAWDLACSLAVQEEARPKPSLYSMVDVCLHKAMLGDWDDAQTAERPSYHAARILTEAIAVWLVRPTIEKER